MNIEVLGLISMASLFSKDIYCVLIMRNYNFYNIISTMILPTGDASQGAFPLQFGSISPGIMNGTQVHNVSNLTLLLVDILFKLQYVILVHFLFLFFLFHLIKLVLL